MIHCMKKTIELVMMKVKAKGCQTFLPGKLSVSKILRSVNISWKIWDMTLAAVPELVPQS